jgi:hypothetical protein
MGKRANSNAERMFMKNIGAFVKEKRLEINKTQSFVADWLNVTFQQIQKYEKNSNDLGLWNFVVYCKKFDVDPGMVISQALDNMYLPDQLIEEGKIQVTTTDVPLVKSKPVNIFEIDKNEND